jgi:PPE-repeat protein
MILVILRRRIGPAIAVVVLSTAVVAAQFGSLSGPVLGYLLDPNVGKLRPVTGIVGSAIIGEPLDTGIAATQVATLDASHGIQSTDTGLELLTLSLDTTQIRKSTIPGVAPNPSSHTISPQATAAAFYYSDSQEIRIVTGLPKEQRFLGAFRVTTPLLQMAVSDDGKLVVYGTSEGENESLYAWIASLETARFLTTAISVSGIAITQNGDAIVSDQAANEVFAIWDAAGAAVRRVLVDRREGLSDPGGIAVSSGNRIYVANSGEDSVMVLDANGRFLKAHPCSCTVSGVIPFRESVFRLTDRFDQPLFLLDATSADERIVFVPPPLQ